MNRRVAPATAALALALVALVAGGCGQSGSALAQQACGHVDTSIRLYHQAQRSTDATVATSKVAQAYTQLRDALPLAAQATSADGRWNALMTAISESARVSEGNLLTALTDECASASAAGPSDQPFPSAPPAPSNPSNPSAPAPNNPAPTSPPPTSVQNGY